MPKSRSKSKNKSKKKNIKIEDAVFAYLVKHPNTSDKKFHAWAEKAGFEHEDAEEVAYKMAAKLARLMKGGRSKGRSPKGMSPKEETMGIGVEAEHTIDKDIANKIAWDHLTEFKTYYEALDAMETQLKANPENETDSTPFKNKPLWLLGGGLIVLILIIAANKKS
jgi:hypothetical protein